jgi:hypothetical protein
LCCGTCLQVADGFKGQLLSYALMASAGHLVLLRRLFPDLDGLHDAMLREVDNYISGPNFATKHGAPDYRVDRTTLQLTGHAGCLTSMVRGSGKLIITFCSGFTIAMPIEDHFEDTNMVPAWPFKLQSLEFSPATSSLPTSCNPAISFLQSLLAPF